MEAIELMKEEESKMEEHEKECKETGRKVNFYTTIIYL